MEGRTYCVCEFCGKETPFIEGSDGRLYCEICGMYKEDDNLLPTDSSTINLNDRG